jgi:hypothetical protein
LGVVVTSPNIITLPTGHVFAAGSIKAVGPLEGSACTLYGIGFQVRLQLEAMPLSKDEQDWLMSILRDPYSDRESLQRGSNAYRRARAEMAEWSVRAAYNDVVRRLLGDTPGGPS